MSHPNAYYRPDISHDYAQGHEYPLAGIGASRNTSTRPRTCPPWLRWTVKATVALALAWWAYSWIWEAFQ